MRWNADQTASQRRNRHSQAIRSNSKKERGNGWKIDHAGCAPHRGGNPGGDARARALPVAGVRGGGHRRAQEVGHGHVVHDRARRGCRARRGRAGRTAGGSCGHRRGPRLHHGDGSMGGSRHLRGGGHRGGRLQRRGGRIGRGGSHRHRGRRGCGPRRVRRTRGHDDVHRAQCGDGRTACGRGHREGAHSLRAAAHEVRGVRRQHRRRLRAVRIR